MPSFFFNKVAGLRPATLFKKGTLAQNTSELLLPSFPKKTGKYFFNPFVPNAPFHFPLKASEDRKVFWYFQGVKKGCIWNEWVKSVHNPIFSVMRKSYFYKYRSIFFCKYHFYYSNDFMKQKASGLQLYTKRDSNTGVFLWILRNFYRTPPGGYFWKLF